ncbi:class I SAM-dependent DNA methyltransferase [Lactobacillus amylovorus]|uniref:class I SAM-dependent DNA methyltransferase n=1 Tax=Lactobacillus amylovorus TaxID=1604 RepID=UPI000E4CD374|nr:DNA methyltransferase [Lactobacillus amylovorus]RGW82139.1 methylase [Lactobacillus amylovorus]
MTKVNKKKLKDFIDTWQNQGSEVADKVTYWNTLLELLGVPKEQIDNKTYIEYEKPIKLHENESFHGSIDAYIPSTHVLIEQKSNGVDLTKPENRPNGNHTEKITPFSQAKRYDDHLGSKEKANFLVLSNFNQIVVYDVRESIDTKPIIINIEDLEKDLYLLNFLVKPDDSKRLEKEKRVSFAAGTLVSQIYNELADIFAKYDQTADEQIKHSINTLCVRLVFCLYAEDAGLFPTKEQFYNYLEPVKPNKMGLALKALFKTLDTKDRKAEDPFWEDENPELAQFPYVNGGLFADEDIIIPPFTEKLKDIILNKASRGFDWSDISPTIFGAVFESTLNPDTRREGGMHYTSIENIHKVIDPLFLDDLKAKLEKIKQYKNQKTIHDKAVAFQEELANLTFFDPACGSGNFLTETFLSLRRLENEAIRLELGGESVLDVGQAKDWIKVSIQQFSGIEINDFAVSVAKTALWIAEDQMMKETQDLLYAPDWDFLPLKTYTRIHEGNALEMDWNKVIPNYACHYIIGNPPFSGLSALPAKNKKLKKQQTEDMNRVFKDLPKHGKLDYVTAWYEKAADMMQGTNIKASFVSTNSITQGEQVGILWKHLIEDKNLTIIFAYRSFVWNNEAKDTAKVHCVIVGFTCGKYKGEKTLFEGEKVKKVDHINGYLIDYDDIYVKSRKVVPPYNMPLMSQGSKPIDGGGLILKSDEYNKFITEYPELKDLVKPYMGASELIKGKRRYCFWLKDVDSKRFVNNKLIRERLKIVIEARRKSPTKSVHDHAEEAPYLFSQIRQPDVDYIAVPSPSSGNRKYIPMAILSKNIIASNRLYIIPSTSLWIFSVLMSSVHMAWVNVVTGRLKSDFSYSPAVYANFPWLDFTNEQKAQLNRSAQEILDAREKYPDDSLADLYDPLGMPPELIKAHKENNKLILKMYNLPADSSEADIVAHLFKMYEKLTK